MPTSNQSKRKKPLPDWLKEKLDRKKGLITTPRLYEVPEGPLPEETELTGQVLRTIFQNTVNGYGVLVLKRADGKKEACLAGNLAGATPGVELHVQGHWTDNPKFGRQFLVENSKVLLPKSKSGIERYLASGILPGINESMASIIVARFGENTLDVLDHAPERLREVPGIGEKRFQSILEAWAKASVNRAEFIFLEGLGLSPAMSQKIISYYEPQSASQIVKGNPYRLTRDIEGIGFLSADKIANSLGIAQDANVRIASGLAYTLDQASLLGHVYLPKSRLMDDAAKLLMLPHENIEKGFDEAIACGIIIALQFPDSQEPLCYLPIMAADEKKLARFIHAHLFNKFPPFSMLAKLPQRPGDIVLNDEQREAVRTALESPISIITGGPGVGKTTVIRRVVDIATANKWRIKLAAPTGRAAKRLSESAKTVPASTIHRLLQYNPQNNRFVFDQDTPLECDLLVVDEVSMLELSLAKNLMAAISPETRLVLVGDKDQLPSVGPGAVLHDLLECGRIPVVSLNQIYRQKEGSRIITSAHDVNVGRIPNLENPPKGTVGEFYFYDKSVPTECQDFIAALCAKSIPQFFGLDPLEDIQVLTPMRKGECGTIALNKRLQEILNPPSPEKPELTLNGTEFQRIFRLGDRVMQTKNNYDKQVFNGDLGRIIAVNLENKSFRVAFDQLSADYNANECSQLLHAYAITIHKSQGCEFPAVVTPLLGQHYVMLQRNLLYTAITRAKKLFVLTGTLPAVRHAVENDTPMTRLTRLTWRLQNPAIQPTVLAPHTPELF
ncbi:MAG: ATP-dependent RecD-like DNA helicase [Lentisphaeria bacterium]|nr:ATP-dependent RecD-like DNA helicase [Lentisphaeria bacterium]